MRVRVIGVIFGLTVMLTILAQAAADGNFQISYSCIKCHEDRYIEWERSMHALAVRDPVFEAAYMRAQLSNPGYRYYCLTCHSPTTRITNDFNLTRSISIEGVTCSFCHTVSGMEGGSYFSDPAGPMRGPYNDSKTDAHASAFSELLTKSEFCAGCHQFSLNNVPISETYTEWKEGPYAAEGKQCQDCHMETEQDRVAAKDGPKRKKVYKHFWYGGHSGQFLENALQIEPQIEQSGNMAKVTLRITNSNVGHKVPSGLPSRKIVLTFLASDEKGRVLFSEERVYAKTIVDQYGNEVVDFWKASSIARDNRIKPKETRTEIFEFEVPEGTGKLEIQCVLTYHVESQILQPVSINAEVAKASAVKLLITPTPTPTPKATGPGWALAVIAVIVAAVCLYRKRR